MTALSIIQNATGQLGLPQPTAVFTSTNAQTIQFRTLMNQEGRELADAHQWTALTKSTSFTTVALQPQAGAIPSDFSRFVNNSMWDQTTARPVKGPISEQSFQMFQAFPVYTNVNPVFLVREGVIIFQPAANAGDTVAYSYVSKNWARSSADVPQEEFEADTDYSVLPEDLIALGVIWRFKKAKGFDYSEEYKTYQQQRQEIISRDGGAPNLNMTYGLNRVSPYAANILQGNWPS